MIAGLAAVAASALAAPRIGVLTKSRGSVWGFVEEGVNEAGAALGADVTMKVPPSGINVGAQMKLFEALTKQEFDALVIAAIDAPRFDEPLKSLVAAGVKIVSVDGPLSPGLAAAHVTHDQFGMAEKSAELTAALVADGDEVAIFRYNQVDRSVIARENHLIKTLKDHHPNLKVRADVFSAGMNSTNDQAVHLLTKYPQAKAIVATTLGATKALLRQFRERNLGDKIHLIGFGVYLPEDVIAAIEEGLIDAWIAQQPKDLGSKAIEAAVALVNGEAVPPVSYAGFTVITKENVRHPETAKLLTAPLFEVAEAGTP